MNQQQLKLLQDITSLGQLPTGLNAKIQHLYSACHAYVSMSERRDEYDISEDWSQDLEAARIEYVNAKNALVKEMSEMIYDLTVTCQTLLKEKPETTLTTF